MQRHGFRATKQLERLGVGTDGRVKEREYENAHRDAGHLQGLNLLQP